MSYDKNHLDKKPKATRKEQPARAAAALERRRNRGNADAADWGSCDSGTLHRVVANVTAAGCTIQFGYTKDGGAFSIRLYDGVNSTQEFVRPTEDVDAYLSLLADDFQK